MNLLSTTHLKSFITVLENQEVGPDGILSKLDNIQTAIRYCGREVDSFPDTKDVMERISLLKSTFRSQKAKRSYERAVSSCLTEENSLDSKLNALVP